MTRPGIVRLSREVFLTVGAALGLICIVATISSVAFDVKPLVFGSGSMSPAIATGDLAVSRTVDASSLERGDIVSVINAGGTRVTHRVVEIAGQGESRQLTLKGDDNQQADAETYTVTRVERVMFDIPKAGYVVESVTGPVGLVLLGGYLVGMLALLVRGRPSDDDDDEAGPASSRGGARKAEKPRRSRSGVRMTAVALAAATAMVAAPAVADPWTDNVPVTGTTLSAHTVAKPAITSCAVTGGALAQKVATVTFTAVSSPVVLVYTAKIKETGTIVTVTGTGATRQIQFSAGLLSTVLNQTYNLEIQAKLPSPNDTWVSVVSTQPVTIGLLGLSLSCGTPT